MTTDHRRHYHRAWSLLSPPLRPHADVVAAVREQMRGRSGRTLLLGVTPELSDIATDLVALDRNISMVAHIWPGDTSSRRATVGDWRYSPFASRSFSTCVGDGSLCGLQCPDEIALLFRESIRILRHHGRFICRLYLSPEVVESVVAVADAAVSGKIRYFHAFKFRLAMALAAQEASPRIAVDTLLGVFNSLFGDRDQLASKTGWTRAEIDTVDHYRGSTVVYNFPKRDQILAVASTLFETVRFIPTGTYEMAERCPLLVADIA